MRHGTRIRLILDEWQRGDSLLEAVRRYCVAVEIPIVVIEAGQRTEIRPQPLVDKTVLATSKANPRGCFLARAFAVNKYGVEGQIAVIAYQDDKGEGWCDCWPADKGLDGKRYDVLPKRFESFVALHGMKIATPEFLLRPGHRETQWMIRTDIRSQVQEITLNRSTSLHSGSRTPRRGHNGGDTPGSIITNAVQETAQSLVAEHLANSVRARGDRGVLYKGDVLSSAPVSGAWRDKYPGTVVTWRNGNREDISVTDLLGLNDLVFASWVMPEPWLKMPPPPMKCHVRHVNLNLPIVSLSETPQFSRSRFSEGVHGLNLCEIERHDDLWLFTFSKTRKCSGIERAHPESPSWVAPIPSGGASVLVLESLGPSGGDFSIIDSRAGLGIWLSNLRAAVLSKQLGIDPVAVEACWRTAASTWWKMDDIVAKWADDRRVPRSLRPPKDLSGNLIVYRPLKLYARSTLAGQ